MKINDYPDYIDEKFRIDFVKTAKERVCWISPKFSKDEIEIANEVNNKLSKKHVNIYRYEKSKLTDEGHHFSLQGEDKYIDIQLFTNNKDAIYDSLLIVDSTACKYNHENTEETQNATFIDNVNEVKLSELKKEIQNKHIIQINLLENINVVDTKGLTEKSKGNPTNTEGNVGLVHTGIITIDSQFKIIQDKICKVTINTPGIRTKDINIDISKVLDIIGRPNKDIADRLMVRWEIFGRDNNLYKQYKKISYDLKEIKKTYTIKINKSCTLILEKNKAQFEIEINKFKVKLKQEAINIMQQKIDDSKLVLENLIIDCHKFAKLNEEKLKTCTEMELESIMENLKAGFPTVDDVTEKCDAVYEYRLIEKTDIENKEFCKNLLIKIRDSDKELAEVLEKIIRASISNNI